VGVSLVTLKTAAEFLLGISVLQPAIAGQQDRASPATLLAE
jgi:hypothetical protein